MKTLTIQDLKQYSPCYDGWKWALTQPDLATLWDNCPRGDWLWWLVRKLKLHTKENSGVFAKACAQSVAHVRNSYADAAAYAAADAVYAAVYAAADAVYAAVYAAADAVYAAADAADAAADAAAYAAAADATADAAAERQKQANMLRKVIKNPFI